MSPWFGFLILLCAAASMAVPPASAAPPPGCQELVGVQSVAGSLAAGNSCFAASAEATLLSVQASDLSVLQGVPLRWLGLEGPSEFQGGLVVENITSSVVVELEAGQRGSVELGGGAAASANHLAFSSTTEVSLGGTFPTIAIVFSAATPEDEVHVVVEEDPRRQGFFRVTSPLSPSLSFSGSALDRISLQGGTGREVFHIGSLPKSSHASLEVSGGDSHDELHVDQDLVGIRSLSADVERLHTRAATCGVSVSSMVAVTISTPVTCTGTDFIDLSAPCIQVAADLTVQTADINLTATGSCGTGIDITSAATVATGLGDITLSGNGLNIGIEVHGALTVGGVLSVGGHATSVTAISPTGVTFSGAVVDNRNGSLCFIRGTTAGASSGDSIGVVYTRSMVAGGGRYRIDGTSGPGTSACQGVVFDDSTLAAATIIVEGEGGDSLDRLNIGVDIRSGTSLSAFEMTVNGTGGGNPSGGDSNHGVLLHQFSALRAARALDVIGFGGSGSTSVHGVAIEPTAALGLSAVGAISISGVAGGTGDSCYGVSLEADLLSGDGDTLSISGDPRKTVSSSDLVGVHIRNSNIAFRGDVTITGSGGRALTDSIGIRLASSAISVRAPLIMEGAGNGSTTGIGVQILSSIIEVDGFDSSITGSGGAASTPSAVGNIGILVSDSRLSTSTDGSLKLEGFGGDGANAYGIQITDTANESVITAESQVSLAGENVLSTSSGSHGVYIDGRLTLEGEALVDISGNGAAGSDCHGVVIPSMGIIDSSTDLAIVGMAAGSATGDTAYGVQWLGQILNAQSLSITGVGGAGTADTIGVLCAGDVTGALPGDVTISGTGGSGSFSVSGVRVVTGVRASSALSITGFAGSSSPPAARGVEINGDLASNRLSVSGTASLSSQNSEGVIFGSSSTITTGPMNLFGQGSNGVSGCIGIGIKSGVVFSLSAGDVTIMGTGGVNAVGSNVGVVINTPISAEGNMVVSGLGGDAAAGVGSTGNHGLYLTALLQATGSLIIDVAGGGGTMSVGALLDGLSAEIDSPATSITATGGTCDAAGTGCHGFQSVDAVTLSRTGTLQLVGTASSSAFGNNIGVLLESGAVFNGAINAITGIGGGGSSGNNIGVQMLGALSGTGNLDIDAIGGTGSSGSHGIDFFLTAIELPTILRGTGGGDDTAGGSQNHGINASADGSLTVSFPMSFEGIGGLGEGSVGVFFGGAAPLTLVDATIIGRGGVSTHPTLGRTVGVAVERFLFFVNGTVTGFGGSGPGSCHGIQAEGRIGGILAGGSLTLNGSSGGDPGSSGNIGVLFGIGSWLGGVSSTVVVNSFCNAASIVDDNVGVAFLEDQDFGVIDLTINGEGCGVGIEGHGVLFDGVELTFEGRLLVNGTGSVSGTQAAGVQLDSAVFNSPPDATRYSFIGVGNTAPGVALDTLSSISNTVTASTGLSITGHSVGVGSGAGREGIFLKGPISSDSGDIRLTGTCAADAQMCNGINVNAAITSGSGQIFLAGESGTGDDVVGVQIFSPAVTTSSGEVIIQGVTANSGSDTIAVNIEGTISTGLLDIAAVSTSSTLGFRQGTQLASTASIAVLELQIDSRLDCEYGIGVKVETGASLTVQQDLGISGRVEATALSLGSTGVLFSSDLILSGDSSNNAVIEGRMDALQNSIGLHLSGTSNLITTTTNTELTGVTTCTGAGCIGLLLDTGMAFSQTQNQLLQFSGSGSGANSEGILATVVPSIQSPLLGSVVFRGTASGTASDRAISLPGLTLASGKLGGVLWFNGATQCPALFVGSGAPIVRFTGGGLVSGSVSTTATTIIESTSLVFATDATLDLTAATIRIEADLDSSGVGQGMLFNGPVSLLRTIDLTGDSAFEFRRTVDCSGGAFDLSIDSYVEFLGNVGSVEPLGELSMTGAGCLFSGNNLAVTATAIMFSHSRTCTMDVPTGRMALTGAVTIEGTMASISTVDIDIFGSVRCSPLTHSIAGSGDVRGTANLRAVMDDFSWVIRGASSGDGRSEGLKLDTSASMNPGPNVGACYEINETFDISGTITVDLDGSNSPCVSEDRFVLRGAAITFDAGAALVIAGSPTLAPGDQLFITDGAGSSSGEFSGLAEHSAVPGCTGPCIISYLGSTMTPPGFDIVLTGNSAPMAVDDAFSVSGLMITVISAPGVLQNDGDPDSADTLTAMIVMAPTMGIVLLNPDGSFSFDPTGVAGPTVVSFTYNAVDDFGATSTATVVLNVGPNGPSLSATPTASPTPNTTPTATRTQTPTASTTTTASESSTQTPTQTATQTQTQTATASTTTTASESSTQTPTGTSTQPPTPTPTASTTTTSSETRTPTSSTSMSATAALSFAATATATTSQTTTATETPSMTETATASQSETVTASTTSTSSTTLSSPTTMSVTSTPGPTGTATPTSTITSTGAQSPSAAVTGSPTATPSSTKSASGTPSNSSSRTMSAPLTPSSTGTPTSAATGSTTGTTSPTASPTPPAANSASASRTKSTSMIIQPSAAIGPSRVVIDDTPSQSATASRTPVPSIRALPSASSTPISVGGGGGQPVGICDFSSITVGAGSGPTSVECEGGGTVVTVSTSSDVPIVITPGDPILVAQAGTDDLVSAVVDVRLLDGTEVPETEICLRVSSEVDDNSCLAFIDESLDPPEWRCEDSCLEYDSSTAEACGSTDHFTNFAILLDGGSAGGDPCGSSDNDFITGVWWGDLTLAASCFLFICCLALLFALVVSFFPPARKLFRGAAGYQASRMRTMNNTDFQKTTRLSSFNSEAAYDGNI